MVPQLLGICGVVDTWGQVKQKHALLHVESFLLEHLFHLLM